MKPIKDHDALEEILERIPDLAPVTFMVPIQGTLAVYLIACANAEGCKPETLVAEAVRAYFGDGK